MSVASQRLVGESVRWPWKLLAVLSSYLLLLGYMIVPVSFEPTHNGCQTICLVFASTFIGLGYVNSIFLAFVQSQNRAFILQSILLPYLGFSLLGLFNIIYNILCRRLFPLDPRRSMIIGLSTVFTFFYGLAALLLYLAPRSPGSGHLENGTVALTDEEMQRRQLLKLLQRRDAAPSPEVLKSTFRIDLPDRVNVARGWDGYVVRLPERSA